MEPTDDRRLTKRQCQLAVLLLTVHVALLTWSAVRHSPNVNEPAHLAAGISHWEFGRFELYRVNPPLIRMVAALPVLLAGYETDWSNYDGGLGARPVFTVGPDFIAANGERSLWLTTLGRLACIPFSLMGGLVCLWWGRDLFGPAAGLVSLTLWCFSPTILGHASCFTPDAHAAALGVAAHYAFWRWLTKPTWGRALVAGLILGLTLLSKTTWILLFGLWPMIFMVRMILPRRNLMDGRPSVLGWFGQFGFMLILGLHVLNLGYLYDGSFRRLGDFQFISQPFAGTENGERGNRFMGTLFADVPVPLPAQFLMGIDVQKQDFERERRTYFLGQWFNHGFWYYYLYVMAIKIPLGIWSLALIALAMKWLTSERLCRRRDEWFLLTPLLFFLVFVSLETGYNAHLRYVLGIFPFAFIWIGQAGTNCISFRGGRLLVAGCLLWVVGGSLSQAPHWLAYFNELVGARHGHEYVANSNIDWGQDLIELRHWTRAHSESGRIGLAYYGMFHPNSIGVEFDDVPGWVTDSEELLELSEGGYADELNSGPQPGWYAVSVNFLVGHHFWNYRADGTRGWFDRMYFRYFQELEPHIRIGRSIWIFHVTDQDVRRLRNRFPWALHNTEQVDDDNR